MHSPYHGGDPADYPQASVGFDYDAVDESIARQENRPHLSPQLDPHTAAEALIKMIAFIQGGDDYLLKVDVISAGSGLALCQGWSYTEMAKRHGITKQAFDKHVLKFQEEFQLPVTRAQKSPQARLSYQRTQLQRQERLRLKHQQHKQKEKEIWQSSSEKEVKVPLAL